MPSSGVVVELATDALADGKLEEMRRIVIELVAGVNVNAWEVFIVAFEDPASTTLGDLCSRAAFDCRPRAFLGCAIVLQTWMPSYHV